MVGNLVTPRAARWISFSERGRGIVDCGLWDEVMGRLSDSATVVCDRSMAYGEVVSFWPPSASARASPLEVTPQLRP